MSTAMVDDKCILKPSTVPHNYSLSMDPNTACLCCFVLWSLKPDFHQGWLLAFERRGAVIARTQRHTDRHRHIAINPSQPAG